MVEATENFRNLQYYACRGFSSSFNRLNRLTSLSLIKLDNIDFVVKQLIPVSIDSAGDSTVGMTPEEITDYVSNVGGNLCGYPEIVKTIIGLSLNISLTLFGILIITYGGTKFIVGKQLENDIKNWRAGYLGPVAAAALSITDSDPDSPSVSSGPSRQARRMMQKLDGKKNKEQ